MRNLQQVVLRALALPYKDLNALTEPSYGGRDVTHVRSQTRCETAESHSALKLPAASLLGRESSQPYQPKGFPATCNFIERFRRGNSGDQALRFGSSVNGARRGPDKLSHREEGDFLWGSATILHQSAHSAKLAGARLEEVQPAIPSMYKEVSTAKADGASRQNHAAQPSKAHFKNKGLVGARNGKEANLSTTVHSELVFALVRPAD